MFTHYIRTPLRSRLCGVLILGEQEVQKRIAASGAFINKLFTL